jgi:UDP-N-acetylmuramate dehydrogenase
MIKIKKKVPLSKYSNYKIGGPARYFLSVKNIQELKETVKWVKNNKLDFFILGGGTNLLIPDDGFSGLIIKPDFKSISFSGSKVKIGAGVSVADILKKTIQKKLSGLEWAGGLPGSFGGAVRGNAGAFGGEIKDNIESVESFDLVSEKIIIRKNSACRFSYRNSIFKEKQGREVIISATVKLEKGDSKKIQESINEKINYRKERQPLEYPNIGSIFKNVDLKKVPPKFRKVFARSIKQDPIPVIPTARLISECGLKGISFGGAMISPKHPNFIVNVLDAKASDVLELMNLIKIEVKKKFNIVLEEEVQIV